MVSRSCEINTFVLAMRGRVRMSLPLRTKNDIVNVLHTVEGSTLALQKR